VSVPKTDRELEIEVLLIPPSKHTGHWAFLEAHGLSALLAREGTEAQTRIKALEELRRYVDHLPDCHALVRDESECECGLRDILAGLGAAPNRGHPPG